VHQTVAVSVICAGLLVGQLANLRKRSDVEQMITGEIVPEPFYEDTYRTEDEMVVSGQQQTAAAGRSSG
jgi:hypothetical protein